MSSAKYVVVVVVVVVLVVLWGVSYACQSKV